MSGELRSSYPGSGLVRNDIGTERSLDRFFSEPASREVARGGRATTPAGGGCAHGPVEFGVESGERSLDRLVVEALAAQVVPDECVASVPVREELSAAEREPLVVQEAGTAERSERFCTLPRDEAQPAQALFQTPLGQGASLQGAGRHGERAVPPQLAAEVPEKRPFELESLGQADPDDNLLRERPPPLSVDIDRDAPGSGGA
jgi:hypothetical protein